MLVWFDIWWEGNSLLSMAWLCGDAAVKFDKRDEPRATASYLTTSAYSGIARNNDLPHMKRIAYTNQSKVRSINLLRGCVIYSWRTLCVHQITAEPWKARIFGSQQHESVCRRSNQIKCSTLISSIKFPRFSQK